MDALLCDEVKSIQRQMWYVVMESDAIAVGKNSCTRYIPAVYIIMKEIEKAAEMHILMRFETAYALGIELPTIYFVS